MTDLVDRLREMAGSPVGLRPVGAGRLCREAADEIERLRAENERLQREFNIACTALGEAKDE